MIRRIDATQASPEAPLMLVVDCPLCDAATPFEPSAAAIDCPACGIRLEVAMDAPASRVEDGMALPTAA